MLDKVEIFEIFLFHINPGQYLGPQLFIYFSSSTT